MKIVITFKELILLSMLAIGFLWFSIILVKVFIGDFYNKMKDRFKKNEMKNL